MCYTNLSKSSQQCLTWLASCFQRLPVQPLARPRELQALAATDACAEDDLVGIGGWAITSSQVVWFAETWNTQDGQYGLALSSLDRARSSATCLNAEGFLLALTQLAVSFETHPPTLPYTRLCNEKLQTLCTSVHGLRTSRSPDRSQSPATKVSGPLMVSGLHGLRIMQVWASRSLPFPDHRPRSAGWVWARMPRHARTACICKDTHCLAFGGSTHLLLQAHPR